MRQSLSFTSELHRIGAVGRDYLSRVIRGDKAHCAEIAKEFGKDYWDGDRRYGYGGYRYDGRWAPLARRLIDHYQLKADSRILDVGAGKGFLLHELKLLLPQAQVAGLDISQYAIDNAKDEIRPFMRHGSARSLPFPDRSFDLVMSLATLHNLPIHELFEALREIRRVSATHSFLTVESYRNETEKSNLLNWQLTCASFFTPTEWLWIFDQAGYEGDHEFFYFE